MMKLVKQNISGFKIGSTRKSWFLSLIELDISEFEISQTGNS